MRELVHQSNRRVPSDHRISVHFLDCYALVRELLTWHDFQAGGEFGSETAIVRFEKTDHDVRAAVFAAMQLLQGRVRLANARRDAKVNAMSSTGARARLTTDTVEHLFGRRSAVLSSHHPGPGST